MADQDVKQHWAKSRFDSKIFDKTSKIDETDVATNSNFRNSVLTASRELYALAHNGQKPSMNDGDLVKWSTEYMRDYDIRVFDWKAVLHPFTTSEWGGKIGASSQLDHATAAQKESFRYLKDVYEKFDDSNLAIIWETFTDPLNVVTTMATGGVGAIGRTAGIKLAGKPLATAFAGAVFEGGITAVADNTSRQHVSTLIGEQQGFEWGQFFQASVTGAVIGGVGGAAFGKFGGHTPTTKAPVHVASPTLPVRFPRVNTLPSTADIAAEAARLSGLSGAGTIANLDKEANRRLALMARHGILQSDIEARAAALHIPRGPNGYDLHAERKIILDLVKESKAANLASTTPLPAAGSIKPDFKSWLKEKWFHGGLSGGGNPAAAPAVIGTSGIRLPEYQTQTDLLKFLMRRNANPFKLFTNWAPLTALPMESRSITRNIVYAVDSFMKDKGLITSIQKMEQDILADVKAGGDGLKILDQFTIDNKAQLQELQNGILELRKHVADTFDTVRDRRKGDLGMVLDATPGLTNGFGKTGLTKGQKDNVLKYLDDMADMAADLQNTKGRNATQMYENLDQIFTGAKSYADFEGPMGLSKAYYQANDAYFRLGGIVPGTKSPAAHQWKERLVRSFQQEFYSGEHPSANVSYKIVVGDENLENTWQNQILEYAERNIAEKDANGQITKFGWNDTVYTAFFSKLEVLEKNGHGQEALYVLDELMRRSQAWDGVELAYLPDTAPFEKYFKNQTKYQKFKADGVTPNPEFSKAYKDWADEMFKKVSVHDASRGGAPIKYFGIFENNRQNRHFYSTQTYPYRFAERHAANNGWNKLWMAKPGYNYFLDKHVNFPLQTLGFFFRGAHHTEVVNDLTHAMVVQTIKPVWKAGEGEAKESAAAVLRRAALRIGSGGLINDLSWNPLKIPSKFAWTLAPFAIAGGAYDYATGKDLKDVDPKTYTAYQLWSLPMIPAKTIGGAFAGAWNDEGPLYGATWGIRDAADAWNPASGMFTPDPKTAPPVVSPGPKTPTGTGTPAPGPGGTITAPAPTGGSNPPPAPDDKAIVLTAEQKTEARKNLMVLDNDARTLMNEIAANGWGDQANAAALKARIDALLKRQQDMFNTVKATGQYESEILNADYQIITMMGAASIDNAALGAVPSSADAETEHQKKYVEQVKLYHDGMLLLTNEVVAEGWNEKRRKEFDDLRKMQQSFSAVTPMLGEDTRKVVDQAWNWQNRLDTAYRNNNNLGLLPISAAMFTTEEERKATTKPTETGGRKETTETKETEKDTAAATKKAAEEKAAAEKAKQDPAQVAKTTLAEKMLALYNGIKDMAPDDIAGRLNSTAAPVWTRGLDKNALLLELNDRRARVAEGDLEAGKDADLMMTLLGIGPKKTVRPTRDFNKGVNTVKNGLVDFITPEGEMGDTVRSGLGLVGSYLGPAWDGIKGVFNSAMGSGKGRLLVWGGGALAVMTAIGPWLKNSFLGKMPVIGGLITTAIAAIVAMGVSSFGVDAIAKSKAKGEKEAEAAAQSNADSQIIPKVLPRRDGTEAPLPDNYLRAGHTDGAIPVRHVVVTDKNREQHAIDEAALAEAAKAYSRSTQSRDIHAAAVDTGLVQTIGLQHGSTGRKSAVPNDFLAQYEREMAEFMTTEYSASTHKFTGEDPAVPVSLAAIKNGTFRPSHDMEPTFV